MPRSRSRSPPRRRRRSRSRSHSPLPSSSSSRRRHHSSRERERDRDGEYSSSSSRRRGREEEGDRDRDRGGRREGRRDRASPSPPRRERGRGKTRWEERPAEGTADVPGGASSGEGEEGRRERPGQRQEGGRPEREAGAGRREGGGQRKERRRERPVPFGEKPTEQEARYEWGKLAPSDDQEGDGEGGEGGEEGGKPKAPQLVAKPDFGLTGALATDSQTGNVYKGVVLKWTEPDDARKPEKGWRLYVFKEGELKDTLHLHRQSAYLVGRHDVADLKVEHPSCSKQHAVIQFRRREEKEGGVGGRAVVKPYLMDLESVNKTKLNGEEVPPARYVELRPQDMIQFGLSSREYVLMHEDMVGK